jgi:NIMA (never in mitosis gene a)-related kinase
VGRYGCVYADGGDLQQLVKRHSREPVSPLPEGQVWRAAVNVLEGLALLHERGILHRDLKTANVFLCGEGFKIGDMNVSKVQEEETELAFTQTGTPYYASPEIWRDEPYGPKADIWSYGCLLYEMCTFRPPFEGNDMESLFKLIRKGKYPPLPSMYSQHLADFIALCLARKVEDRPSAQKLLNLRIVSIKSEEYGIPRSRPCHFKLLKAIKFEDGDSPALPDSCYEPHNTKKFYTE